MKITRDELNQILARNKQLSIDEDSSRAFLSRPELEPERRPALDPLLPGAQESGSRVIVCFTGFRVRPCDPDNFAGGVKALLDCLRHSGLIPGDDPSRIELVTRQVKVKRRSEERTEITISD